MRALIRMRVENLTLKPPQNPMPHPAFFLFRFTFWPFGNVIKMGFPHAHFIRPLKLLEFEGRFWG